MRLELVPHEGLALPEGLCPILQSLGDYALLAEGLTLPCQVTLLITGDEGIRAINRELRGLDRPTDVLSFPSATYPAGTTARQAEKRLRREYDPETGCIHLGDIILSLERAEEQAAAFGHAHLREMGFLFVHGMLHLMGYDHEGEKERALMGAMEESIMAQSGISRTLTERDFALITAARKAMERAYVPYSGYRVGAALMDGEGRIFMGCNVENASYGLTICAERNAITTAIAEGGRDFAAIAIAAEGAMPFPCGACRQFLREFAKDLKVVVTNSESIRETTLKALLPDSFGPESLQQPMP